MSYNSFDQDSVFGSLLSKNLAILLKIAGFDSVQNTYTLNYLNDIYLNILNNFIIELKNITESNATDEITLDELRLLLNKTNTINDTNYNIDSTVLQLNDYTNDKHTTIYHENDTQGIEAFKKWVFQNTLFNIDYKNVTKDLAIKNLDIFNNPEIPVEIPEDVNSEEQLDWVTFSYLNNLQDTQQILFYVQNYKKDDILYDGINDTSEEIILNNDKNDVLDTIITPDILKPLSISNKRKTDFLADNNIDRQNWNNENLDKLNELRNNHYRNKIKLSYEEK